MKTSKKPVRVIIIGMIFFLLLCLVALLFCAGPAPAASTAELKAELVKKYTGGNLSLNAHRPGATHLSRRPYQTPAVPVNLQPVVAKGKVYIFTTEDLAVTTGLLSMTAPKAADKPCRCLRI